MLSCFAVGVSMMSLSARVISPCGRREIIEILRDVHEARADPRWRRLCQENVELAGGPRSE
eukprot:122047-Prorocentrum_minimum.AAC.1